jgi:hypothetical protein
MRGWNALLTRSVPSKKRAVGDMAGMAGDGIRAAGEAMAITVAEDGDGIVVGMVGAGMVGDGTVGAGMVGDGTVGAGMVGDGIAGKSRSR